MSLRLGYRSNGNWNSERSVFEFKDEFGQDPIMGRYGSGPGSQALAEARVARSASEVQLAQASLDAMTRPAKVMSDFFTTMNQTAKAKDDMLKRSRVSAQSIKLRERLSEANDYDSLTALRADPELSDAFEDETMAGQYDSKLRGLRARGIATLQNRLPKATSTAEVDGLVNEYSWLAGDQEAQTLINTFTPLAQRREVAMKGLVEAGAQQMPVTRTGEFDLDRAEKIVEPLSRTDVRTLSSAQRGLQQQLSDIDNPESPEAVALQSDLTNINRQIANVANRSDQQTTRAAMDLQSLGASPEAMDEELQGILGIKKPAPAPAVTEPTAPAPATPAPAPVTPPPEPISLEEEIAQTAEAGKRDRVLRSVQPKLEARKAEKESKIDKAERRLKRSNLINERERLNKAITDAGLGDETDVIQRAKARIAEINQELGE